jgi:hypothetical protein
MRVGHLSQPGIHIHNMWLLLCLNDLDDKYPKANPVSLRPLTYDEALKHLAKVDPDKVGLTPERRKLLKILKPRKRS